MPHRSSRAAGVVLAAALAATGGAVVASAPATAASSCTGAAKTFEIKNRKGISCAEALRVTRRVEAAALEADVRIPQCLGQRSRTLGGWKVSRPRSTSLSKHQLVSRFTKGKRSFRKYEQGSC